LRTLAISFAAVRGDAISDRAPWENTALKAPSLKGSISASPSHQVYVYGGFNRLTFQLEELASRDVYSHNLPDFASDLQRSETGTAGYV